MATELQGFKFTLPANADLSSSQYLFAVLAGTGAAAVAGSGVDVIGVICNKPTSGKATEIAGPATGIVKVKSGAAISVNAKVMSNGSGQAITATATNKAVGWALDASTGSGQIIRVLLQNLGTQ